ncbi:MAG: MoxR family ATPase [Clostridiaceae bacterium]|nr:MoxR family ATPase [Clostridiaceae bacterium]
MEKNMYYEKAEAVIAQVGRAVIGKEDYIRKAVAAIFAGGHILIDDIPGVGKTTLAMALSKAMELESRRIQFTPDVMPSDIVGFSLYRKETGEFVYQPGAVMCNLFLGDEINRTLPKTQSALLEVMEENRVTVDGVTRSLPEPFIVIATENPAGSVGTQLLPESQLDRFMICMTMGYPLLEDEVEIAKGKSSGIAVQDVETVMSVDELLQIRRQVDEVYVHDKIYYYICHLVKQTRENAYIEMGVSPRGTIALVRMAKAIAYLDRRDYVTPEDVNEIFLDVTSHRILLNARARTGKMNAEKILQQILENEKKPASQLKGRSR